jgi:hypothetical protein
VDPRSQYSLTVITVSLLTPSILRFQEETNFFFYFILINSFHAEISGRNKFFHFILLWWFTNLVCETPQIVNLNCQKCVCHDRFLSLLILQYREQYISFVAWKVLKWQVKIIFNAWSLILPSLFMPICRHFFRRQAWHWFRCALSTMQRPVPAWHLRTLTRKDIQP